MDETEQRFNEYVWYVLKHLKEEILATGEGKPIVYKYKTSVIAPGVPSTRRIEQIVRRLEEWECLKILTWTSNYWPAYNYKLEIIPKRFEEVYSKYRNLINPPVKKEEEDKELTLGKYRYHVLNLQRIYDSYIDLPQKDFFRGVADYVLYIDENDELEPLVKRITEKMDAAQQDLGQVEDTKWSDPHILDKILNLSILTSSN